MSLGRLWKSPAIVAGYHLSDVNDFSNSYDLSNVNTVTFSLKRFDNGAVYNGSSNYLWINSKLGFTAGNNNISIFKWFYFTSAPSAGTYYSIIYFGLLSNPGGSGTRYYYRLAYTNNGGTYQLYWGGRGTAYNVTLSTNTWYWIGMTVDSANNACLYINGVKVATGSGTDTASHTSSDQDSYSLGAERYGSTLVATYLPGGQDEDIVLDSVLTPQQVRRLFAWATGKLC